MSETQQKESPKIGAGHLAAMGRAGLKELSQALTAFPDGAIRPVEEAGLFGNLTPQEVVHGKTPYESTLDSYSARGETVQQQQQGLER